MPTWFVDDPKTFALPPGRSSAKLIDLSENVSAQELSDFLGIPPDDQWEREELPGPRRRYSGYSLRSRLPESAQPAEHLTDLLERIAPIAARVRGLTSDDRIASVRVWLGHHIPNWNPGLSISAEQLHQLDEIGAGLEIDVYVTE